MQKELKELVVGDDVLVTESQDEKKHPAKVIQVDREKGTFRVHYMGWRASYDRDFFFSTKDVVFFHKPARPLKEPRYEVEAQVIAVYRKDGQRYGGVIKKAEAHPDCPLYVVKFYDGVRQLKTRETDISPYSEEEAKRGIEFAEMQYNKELGSSADEAVERPSPRRRTDSESSVKTNNSEPPKMVDLNSPGMRVKPRRSSGRVSKRRSSISRPSPLVANSVSSADQDRPSPSSLSRIVSKSEKSAFTAAKSAKKTSQFSANGESLEMESSYDFVEETSDKVAIKLRTSAENESYSETASSVEQKTASGQRAWSARAHASKDSTVPTRKSVTRQNSAEPSGQATRSRKSLRERKSSENRNQSKEENPKSSEAVRRSSPRKQPAKAEAQEEKVVAEASLPKPKLATPSRAVPTRASAVSERLNSIGSDDTARDSEQEGTQVSPPKRSTRLGKSAEMEELRHLLGAEGYNKKVKIFTLEKWWLGKVIPPRGKIPKEIDIATHVFCHFFNWPRRSDCWFKCLPEFIQFVPHVDVPEKHLFKVGDRVLAEWKSTRASAEGIWCAASVHALLPKTMYHVIFDDGIHNKLTHDRVKLMTPTMEREAKKNLDEFMKKLADEIPKDEKIDVTAKPVRKRKSIYGSVPSKRSASANSNPSAAKKAKVATESKAKETAAAETSTKKAVARRTPRKITSPETDAAIEAASSSGNLSRPASRNSGNISPFSELATASRPPSRPTTPARPVTPVLTDANSEYVKITAQLSKYDELDSELRELEDELKKNIEERERRIRDGLLVEYDGVWYNLVGGQEDAVKMIKFILDKPDSQIAKSVKTDAVNRLERTLEAGVILDVDGEIDNLKDSQSTLVAELLSLRKTIEKQDANYDYCFFDKESRCFMRAQFCKPGIWKQIVLHLRYKDPAKACEIYKSESERNLTEEEEERKRVKTQKENAEKAKVEKKKPKKIAKVIKKEKIEEEAKIDEAKTGEAEVNAANVEEEASIVVNDQPATEREGRPRTTGRRASSAKSGANKRTPAATRRASIAASSSEARATSKILRKAIASASTTPISSPARSRSPAVSLAGSDASNSSASRRTRTRLSIAPEENTAAAEYGVGDLIWARWKDTRAYGGIVVDVLDKFYVFRFALDGIEANIAFDRTEGKWEPEMRPDENFLKFYENLRRDTDSKKVKTALLNAKVAFEKMLKAKKNPKVEKSPPKSSEKKTAAKAGKDKSLGTLVQRLAKKKMEEEEGASSSTPPAPEPQKAPEQEKQQAPLKKSRKTSKPSRLSQDPPEKNELSKEEKEQKLNEMRDYIEKVSKKVLLEDQKKEKERLRKIKPIQPGEVISIDDDDEDTEVKKELSVKGETESGGDVASAIIEQPMDDKKTEKASSEEEKPAASTDSSPVRRSRRVRAQTDSEASPQQEKVKLSVRSSSQEQLKSPTRAQRRSVSPEKLKSPPKSPKKAASKADVSTPAAESTSPEKLKSPGRPKVQKQKSPARSAAKPTEAKAKSPARAATDAVETKEEGVKKENSENEDKIAKRTRRRTNTVNSSPARSPAARTSIRKRKNSEMKASPRIGKIRKVSETVSQSSANSPIPEIATSVKESAKEMVEEILRDVLFNVVKKSNAKTYRRIAKEKKARLAAQAAPPKSVSSPAPPTRQMCPVKSCKKTFRKTGHLQGHLKHYHADYLRENMDDLLGSTDDEGAEAASSADEDEWTRSPARAEREEQLSSPKKEYVTVPTTGTFEDILMPDFNAEQQAGLSLEDVPLAIEEPVEPKKGYVCACGAWEGKELYYQSDEHKGQPHRQYRRHTCTRPRAARNLKATHQLKEQNRMIDVGDYFNGLNSSYWASAPVVELSKLHNQAINAEYNARRAREKDIAQLSHSLMTEKLPEGLTMKDYEEFVSRQMGELNSPQPSSADGSVVEGSVSPIQKEVDPAKQSDTVSSPDCLLQFPSERDQLPAVDRVSVTYAHATMPQYGAYTPSDAPIQWTANEDATKQVGHYIDTSQKQTATINKTTAPKYPVERPCQPHESLSQRVVDIVLRNQHLLVGLQNKNAARKEEAPKMETGVQKGEIALHEDAHSTSTAQTPAICTSKDVNAAGSSGALFDWQKQYLLDPNVDPTMVAGPSGLGDSFTEQRTAVQNSSPYSYTDITMQVIAPVSSSASSPLPNEPANEPAKPIEDAKKEPIPKSSFQSLSTVDINKLNQDDHKRIRHAKKNQQWLDEVNERAQKDKARSAELSKGTEKLLKEERAKRIEAKEKSKIPPTFEGIFGETIKLGATQQRKDKKKKSKEGPRNFK